MSTPSTRLTEEICVGFYLLIALFSAITYVGVQLTSGSAIGGAFLVIAVFWLCVCTGVATALVVLFVNISRTVQGTNIDRVATLFAMLILVSLGAALYLGFMANHLQVAMLVGAVGLVIAPLGLFVTVFESRIQHLLAERRV